MRGLILYSTNIFIEIDYYERENVMLNMITKTRIATIKTVHITTVYGPFFAFSDIGKDKQ